MIPWLARREKSLPSRQYTHHLYHYWQKLIRTKKYRRFCLQPVHSSPLLPPFSFDINGVLCTLWSAPMKESWTNPMVIFGYIVREIAKFLKKPGKRVFLVVLYRIHIENYGIFFRSIPFNSH